MLFFHLSFGFVLLQYKNSIFGGLCYAQESDQPRKLTLEEVEEALQKAEDEDIILLSPDNFAEANKSYYKAFVDSGAGQSPEKVQENLQRTMDYLNAAYEKARLSRSVLKDLIQTRKEAKALEIPERAAYIYSKADSIFGEAAGKVESGDSASARSIARDAEREYRAAIIEALIKFTLAGARQKLATMSEESARKAKAELDRIEEFIQAQGATDFAIGKLVGEVDDRIKAALKPSQPEPVDTKPRAPMSVKSATDTEQSLVDGGPDMWDYIVLCIVAFLSAAMIVIVVSSNAKRSQTTDKLIQAMQKSTEAITEAIAKMAESMQRSAEVADKLAQVTASSSEAIEQMARTTEKYAESANQIAQSTGPRSEIADQMTHPPQPQTELSEGSLKIRQLDLIDSLNRQVSSASVRGRRSAVDAIMGIHEKDSVKLKFLKQAIFREKLDRAYEKLVRELLYDTARKLPRDISG